MNFAYFTANFTIILLTVSFAVATLIQTPSAAADASDEAIHTYALLVGSNESGPG